VDRLVKEIPEIKSVVLNVNTKRTNVILGDENIVVYGRDTITDYIGEFKFNISPLSFFSGESCSNGSAVSKGVGLCAAYRQGDCF